MWFCNLIGHLAGYISRMKPYMPIWNLVQVLYSRLATVNIFVINMASLKQNAAVTQAKLWISSLHFPVCITHPTHSWMSAELCLDHMEAAQGSSLHRMDGSFKRHAVQWWSSPHCEKLTVDSFYMLLRVYYLLLPATSAVSWLGYTLNNLDISGIQRDLCG